MIQTILPIYNPETNTFELSYKQARNLDYWARKGLYAEQTQISLSALIDQVTAAKIEGDSVMIDLQRRHFDLKNRFTALDKDYDDLEDKVNEQGKDNARLATQLNIANNENNSLIRQRNTAWWIAGGEAVLIGVLVGILVSR